MVKLTGPYRISTQPLPHPDTVPFARALVTAGRNASYGEPMAHRHGKERDAERRRPCDLLLLEWVPDAALRSRCSSKTREALWLLDLTANATAAVSV